MSKSIELAPIQIKAYKIGVRHFILPFKVEIQKGYEYQGLSSTGDMPYRATFWNDRLKDILFVNLPMQKRDKHIFVQEEFTEIGINQIKTRYEIPNNEWHNYDWQLASKMTKEQSRYSFEECLDIKVTKVQDIKKYKMYQIILDMLIDENSSCNCIQDDFEIFFNEQMKEQKINKVYEDGDYIFLVKLRGIK